MVLVDAQAVLGAAAKGRSSSRCLARDIARIGALAMAGDLLLKLVYIPSEDNPADAPSRGVVRRWRTRPSAIPAHARQHNPLQGVVRKVKQLRKVIPQPSLLSEVNTRIYRAKHMGTRSERQQFRDAFDYYDFSHDGESISSAFSV